MTSDTWRGIERDYFSAHVRRLVYVYGDDGPDEFGHTITEGAVLLQKILAVVEEEPSVGVREAAVRYLLNRDFSFPETMVRGWDRRSLDTVDVERDEMRVGPNWMEPVK